MQTEEVTKTLNAWKIN